jgi:serine protease AprX
MFKFKKQILQTGLLVLSFSLPFSVNSQEVDDKISRPLLSRLKTAQPNETIPLFIYFKDKGDNIDNKMLQAKTSLSPRSLRRRIINLGVDNVVSFKDIPINPDYLHLVKSQVSKVRHSLNAMNAVSVEATADSITKISKYDFVQKIEAVKRLKRAPNPLVETKDNKSFANAQTDQIATPQTLDYGQSLIQNNQINVPAVHELGYTGSGVVVAVFDSGFNRLSHESFNQIDIAGKWDFVNDDDDVGDSSDMGTGSHGTNTLSAIGGFASGNLIGPAYGATYFLAKTENTESELHVEEDNWCAAAQWAETNGADIITSSLGYRGFDTGGDNTPSDMDGDTTIVTQCADLAAEVGIVVINSAGNEGANEGSNTIGAPSDGNFVLAVGAVTSTGSQSSFSSEGPSADGRIKPDVMAMGSSVRVASTASDTLYTHVNGTSFSCPLTAGVAALVLQANNNLTAAQVRDILRNSGHQTATPDNSFGYGIIDALSALEAAIALTPGSIAPNASFAVVTSGTSVNLTNTSTDSDGTIDSFSWDFGDESTSSEASTNHTYSTAGSYSITLTVTDNDGLTESVSRNITISSSTTPTETPSSSGGGGGSSFYFILVIGLFVATRKRAF